MKMKDHNNMHSAHSPKKKKEKKREYRKKTNSTRIDDYSHFIIIIIIVSETRWANSVCAVLCLCVVNGMGFLLNSNS